MADVLLTLDVDEKGVVRGVRNADGELQRLEDSTKSAGREAETLGSRFDVAMGVVAAAAIATAAAAVANFARSIVSTAADFEDSMARVGALSQATADELEQLTETARGLGATTRFSAQEAANGMAFLAQSGFEVNEIMDAMPGLLAQASAGQVDLGTASRITSDIMQGFNLEARDTGRIADILASAFTSSNTTLESLGETMSFVAPIASGVGLSVEELAAAAGLLGDAGIQGSRAGTALRRTIGQLNAPTGAAAELMGKLQIRTTDAAGEMLPLADIIEQLEQRFEGMSGAQRTANATQLVGEEAAAGFNALLSQGSDRLREYTSELRNSAGAAEEIAAIQEDTLAGSLRSLNSALDELRLSVAETFENEYRSAVDSAVEATRTFSKFIKENRDEIATVVRLLPELAKGLALVIGVTKGLTVAVGLFNAAIRANPFGLILTAIQIVVVALFSFRKRLAAVFADVIDIIAQAVSSVQSFTRRLGELAEFIPGMTRATRGLATAFQVVEGVLQMGADKLREYAETSDDPTIGLNDLGDAAEGAGRDLQNLNTDLDDTSASFEGAASGADGFTESIEEADDAFTGFTIGLSRAQMSLINVNDTIREVGAQFRGGMVPSIASADEALGRLRGALRIATSPQQRAELRELIVLFAELRSRMQSGEQEVRQLGEATGETSNSLSAATGAAQQFSDSLADGLIRGQNVAQGLLGTLRQIASQLLSRGILALLTGGAGGGVTGLLGGLFGGGRHRGGSVQGGRVYEINEGRGQREFFQPSSGGRVLPLGRGGQGTGSMDIRVRGTLRADMGELVAEIDEQRTINDL